MDFTIEHEQGTDGRWLAEVLEIPGVLAYGATPEQAIAKAQALALRVIADRIEHGEKLPEVLKFSILPAVAWPSGDLAKPAD
jgi:predicted RNase H-like HicB family nuclease